MSAWPLWKELFRIRVSLITMWNFSTTGVLMKLRFLFLFLVNYLILGRIDVTTFELIYLLENECMDAWDSRITFFLIRLDTWLQTSLALESWIYELLCSISCRKKMLLGLCDIFVLSLQYLYNGRLNCTVFFHVHLVIWCILRIRTYWILLLMFSCHERLMVDYCTSI